MKKLIKAGGKFYRSAGSVAQQEQIIKVAPKGTLEWFPSENIIFSGARAQIQTKIELSHDSNFMGWEISCLGRPASDEYFSKGELDQRFEVWRDGRPLRFERLWLKGDNPILKEKWGLWWRICSGKAPWWLWLGMASMKIGRASCRERV